LPDRLAAAVPGARPRNPCHARERARPRPRREVATGGPSIVVRRRAQFVAESPPTFAPSHEPFDFSQPAAGAAIVAWPSALTAKWLRTGLPSAFATSM